jgi:hypothetical protein
MDPRGGAPGGRRRLGEVLVAGKVVSEAQLEEALRTQREDKGRRRRLGEVITTLGFAAIRDLAALGWLEVATTDLPPGDAASVA